MKAQVESVFIRTNRQARIDLPQKNEPGFFSALRCRSLPTSPTASTAAALGAYPDSRTSKSVR